VLSDENQGVCSWGVSSDGDGEVVVGGDLLDARCATVVYAASAADFIAARRWDHRCLTTGPVLQAQAAELDWWVSAASDAALRQFTAGLLDLPGVGQALWSNDEDGERLLSETRRLLR
jgi:hypothetical protein